MKSGPAKGRQTRCFESAGSPPTRSLRAPVSCDEVELPGPAQNHGSTSRVCRALHVASVGDPLFGPIWPLKAAVRNKAFFRKALKLPRVTFVDSGLKRQQQSRFRCRQAG